MREIVENIGASKAAMEYDLIIRSGTLVDGSGAPGYRSDVALKDGKIAAVGKLGGEAAQNIDADGLIVAPGFIDFYTHLDAHLLWDPLAASSTWHGVTTVVIGNGGYGLAPATRAHREYVAAFLSFINGIPLDVLKTAVDWEWETFGDYLRRLSRDGLGVNVAAQVPHSLLRYHVMGPDASERSATPEEVQKMRLVLREAMAEGAIGFSSLQVEGRPGPFGKPIPSVLATAEELHDLGMTLGEVGAGVISISPKPGAGVIDPEYQEFMIRWSRDTGRPVVWGQFLHRWDQPDKWREMLDFMDRAASQGAQIYAVVRCHGVDTDLSLLETPAFDFGDYPTWQKVMSRPHEEKKQLLAEREIRARLWKELDPNSGLNQPRRLDLLEIKHSGLSKNKALEGRRVVDLAAEQGKSYIDCLLDLALAEDLQTRFVYVGVINADPKAVAEIIKGTYCLPGASDAGGHPNMVCGVGFPGIMLGHWVREQGVMTLEEGVRRLTSLPAQVLGLKDRGLLREGMAGDLVIFDPVTIQALPTEVADDIPGGHARIIQRAAGVHAVIVNGEVIVRDGQHTGERPGKVLGVGR